MAKPKKPLEAPGGRFFALPHAVLDSEAWRGCSAPARALLMEVCRQHTGSNNGHLHLARTWMESRGWNRPATVIKLRHELERRRLLVQTRHGGLNNGAHRFALTWLPVSNFTGLDITARDYHPGAYLLAPMPEPDKKQNARTPHVLEKQSTRTPHVLAAKRPRTPHVRKKAISETSPRTPHVHNEYIPIPTAQIPRTSLEEPITEAAKTAERPNRNNHQPKEKRNPA
jgi:hypothetical protein